MTVVSLLLQVRNSYRCPTTRPPLSHLIPSRHFVGRPRGLWAVDRRKMSYKLRDRINTCSTIYDFEQLDNLHNTMANKHVTVVGGGFLGTELALALSVRGRESGMSVSHVYAEKAPLARYIPTYLALHVQRLMHSAGVRCVSERLVTDFKGRGWIDRWSVIITLS